MSWSTSPTYLPVPIPTFPAPTPCSTPVFKATSNENVPSPLTLPKADPQANTLIIILDEEVQT